MDPSLFNERDNALSVIAIELSRLLAVVMAGTWTVIRPAPGKHFIANDRGWYLIGMGYKRTTPAFSSAHSDCAAARPSQMAPRDTSF